MNSEKFDKVVDEQLKVCKDVLSSKSNEYAAKSRLHNFEIAADMEGVSIEQALAGMMAKHTVSIYDLCFGRITADRDIWDEKITDSINYLLLLKAAICREDEKPYDPHKDPRSYYYVDPRAQD